MNAEQTRMRQQLQIAADGFCVANPDADRAVVNACVLLGASVATEHAGEMVRNAADDLMEQRGKN